MENINNFKTNDTIGKEVLTRKMITYFLDTNEYLFYNQEKIFSNYSDYDDMKEKLYYELLTTIIEIAHCNKRINVETGANIFAELRKYSTSENSRKLDRTIGEKYSFDLANKLVNYLLYLPAEKEEINIINSAINTSLSAIKNISKEIDDCEDTISPINLEYIECIINNLTALVLFNEDLPSNAKKYLIDEATTSIKIITNNKTNSQERFTEVCKFNNICLNEQFVYGIDLPTTDTRV